MPDITLPHSFSAGDKPTALQVNEDIYKPRSVPDNFSVLNGQVGPSNFAFSKLARGVAAPGTFTLSRTVGGTSNLDYFDNWYEGIAGSEKDPPESRYIAIPGLACNFYVPWNSEGGHEAASAVYLFWHFSCIIDNDRDETWHQDPPNNGNPPAEGNTRFNLFVDGEQTDIYALFMRGRHTMIPRDDSRDDPFNNSVIPDTRMWSAGIVIDGTSGGYQPLATKGVPLLCSKGWHSASIRLAGPAHHVRVKTRHFGYRLYR
jgi:hypothetical protein